MRKFISLLFVGLAVFVTQVAVQAQTTGSLAGTITDQQKAVVAGATVTLNAAVAGAERTAVTDSEGAFNFQALMPGTYTISVEAAGFKKSVARDITINVGLASAVTLELEVGLAGETVTVTTAQEVINTASPSLTATVNTRQVVDLPIGNT